MAERSEANIAKQNFASKYYKKLFLTRSFASRFKLRFAQLFLAKFKLTTNWPLSPQGLNIFEIYFFYWKSSLKTRKVDSVASEEPRKGRESNFMMLFVVAGKALERKKSPLRGYANSSWHHPYSFYCFGLSREPSSASFSHCI